MDWYQELAKPAWAPPAPVFGIVWSILYPIIIVAYGYVIYRVARGEFPAALLVPILLNVVANVAFTRSSSACATSGSRSSTSSSCWSRSSGR